MQYESFKEEIIARLADVASAHNCELVSQTISKVNMNNVDSVSFRRKDLEASPTMYIDDMYKRFTNGKSIDELIYDVEKMFENGAFESFNLDLSPEMLQANCFPQLIGKAGNEELLKSTPHRTVGEDMAVIVRVNVGNDGSFIVKEPILEQYHVGKNELIDCAISNLEHESYELKPLNAVIEGIIGIPTPEVPDEAASIMVLTNSRNAYGAAELINRKAMQEASKAMKSDDKGFFILPSSLHEALLVPIPQDEDPVSVKKALKDMVKSVNDTTVDAADLLSYSVYFYNPHKQCIENADSCDFSFGDNDRCHMHHRM